MIMTQARPVKPTTRPTTRPTFGVEDDEEPALSGFVGVVGSVGVVGVVGSVGVVGFDGSDGVTGVTGVTGVGSVTADETLSNPPKPSLFIAVSNEPLAIIL